MPKVQQLREDRLTIEQALRWARVQLVAVSDAPELDAQWLLLHVLKRDEASWLVAHADEQLAGRRQVFEQLVARRATGEPLPYILGEWEFYGRQFVVSPDVLIPRPSTEGLVDRALELLRQRAIELARPLRIADVGCGSGCIGITLLLEGQSSPPLEKGTAGVPELIEHVYATDISPTALQVAQVNAQRHGVASAMTFLTGDLLAPLEGRHIDVIVSNPPYVPTDEVAHPSPTPLTAGLAYEPKIALDGGVDGQRYIDQIHDSGIPSVIEVTGGGVEVFNC